MRRIYFGGSFNPVHRAHLICSAFAGVAAGFEAVSLVPTGQPNLKQPDYPLATPQHRLAMLQLGIGDFARGELAQWYARTQSKIPGQPIWPARSIQFEIEPLELARDRASYTIDTAEQLLARGVTEVNWLIGADQLLGLHRWHRFETLMQIVQFHVMHRPSYVVKWDDLHPRVQKLRDRLVEVPQLPISATEIRRRIVERLPLEDLLTPGVSEYIALNGLYL